jgi:ABC-type dipeptide/oligopeptide/nickel transport system permease component
VTAFLLRRAAQAIPVLLGVTFVAFLLTYLLPGDPARALAGERYREEDLARIRAELGLDRPAAVQYASYVARLLRGDLGRSFATGRPVAEELLERFPRTVVLAVASLGVAIALGISLGVASARRPGGLVDRASMVLALGGISVPVFVSAILLLWLFAVTLRWLPPSGWIAEDPRALVLPAFTLGVRSAAMVARMTRASLVDVLSADYVRTGRAKGCAEARVLVRHALRNALVPVVTLVGLDFGSYLSGSVLTESIFAWPGVGQYAMQAILRRDFPAIQGTVLFLSAIFVAVNLAVDLAYGVLDPRIRRAWLGREAA